MAPQNDLELENCPPNLPFVVAGFSISVSPSGTLYSLDWQGSLSGADHASPRRRANWNLVQPTKYQKDEFRRRRRRRRTTTTTNAKNMPKPFNLSAAYLIVPKFWDIQKRVTRAQTKILPPKQSTSLPPSINMHLIWWYNSRTELLKEREFSMQSTHFFPKHAWEVWNIHSLQPQMLTRETTTSVFHLLPRSLNTWIHGWMKQPQTSRQQKQPP